MALTRATYSMIEGAPISVLDYGAVAGGDATANRIAIQAAADAAASTGAYLVGAPGVFTVDATINLVCSGDLGEMTIEADATSVSPIVRFGTTTAPGASFKTITLPAVRNNNRTSGTWGTGIAVELANCNTCTINVTKATECEVGVSAGGYDTGFAYCTVNLQYVYSNKINLRLQPKTSGWCNQNLFNAGRLGANSSDFTVSGYTGTRQIEIDGSLTSFGGPDNNTFVNTSIETSVYEYMIAFEKSAAYNVFMNLRYEGSAKNVLFNTDLASGINSNLFIGGYQAASLNFVRTGAGSSVYNCLLAGRGNWIDTTGTGFNIMNRTGNTESAPHLMGFSASATVEGKTGTATDWRYRLYADGLSFKEQSESFNKVTLSSGQTGNPSLRLGSGAATPDRGITIAGTTALVLEAPSGGVVRTDTDNSTSLGNAAYRWSEVFAGTGTINTSDASTKQDVLNLEEAEKRVAITIKGLIKKFRFKDAVANKGDAARIHIGVIAQEVQDAFVAEGLDASKYGLFCSNVLEDGTVRLGVRYGELLAFVIAAL